jgi:tRNA(adenine34) deaminase
LSGSEAGPGGSDESYLRLALELGARAGEAGEVPVGAVVVRRGEVIGRGANAREATGDPTAHAEVLAIREAARATGSWRLVDSGALVAARLGRLVFGAADPKAGACGSLYNLCADPRLNHELPVVRGVLAQEAALLLSGWFAARRV